MDYKKAAADIGLSALEDMLMKVAIPYLEEKVADSESKVDDMVMAAVKPALMELIDKMDGEEG